MDGPKPTRSKLTPELRTSLLDALAKGTPRREAARSVGISYASLKAWMARGRKGEEHYLELLRDIRQAEARAIGGLVKSIDRAGKPRRVVIRKTRTLANGTVVTEETAKIECDWAAAAWLLEKLAPDEFGSNRAEIRELEAEVSELYAKLGIDRAARRRERRQDDRDRRSQEDKLI